MADYEKSDIKLRFVELCAGIGGLRRGLEDAGWYCLQSVELDRTCVSVHQTAFGDCLEADIHNLNAQDLPDHEMLVAGFPCQPFSTSGNRTGFTHQSGTVFSSIARLLRECCPPLVLLENVQGLLANQGGLTMATVLQELTNLGYRVSWAVLNASWFGVPQNRPRVFLMGTRNAASMIDFDLFGTGYLRLDSANFEFLKVPLLASLPVVNEANDLEQFLKVSCMESSGVLTKRSSFGVGGMALGRQYVSIEKLRPLKEAPMWSDVGDIVSPSFWRRDQIRSARYWGHSGKTRVYLRSDGLAHCVGTTIGSAPMFAIEEKFLRTRSDENALLEHANWSRSENGLRVFRLNPKRAFLLFGPEMDGIADACADLQPTLGAAYRMLGNAVVPRMAEFCGRVAAKCLAPATVTDPSCIKT
jgi:DNA-cytosine methyltransferase